MNTAYAVGNIRIRFESRTPRRWLVVLFYVVVAALDLVWFSMHSHSGGPSYPEAWIDIGLGIFFVALWIIFTWLADDMCKHRDERETHRREHAYARAYRPLGYFLVTTLWAGALFWGPNPITPHLPPASRAFLMPLPFILLLTTFLLFATLPQAILLWTEPDMEEAQ